MGNDKLAEFELTGGYRYVPVPGEPEKPYNVHLRHGEKGTPFEWAGQGPYDELGEDVIAYLQLALEEAYGLERVTLADGTHVFASPGLGTARDVCVIIHGSGAVRAGMWARQLCINDTLRTGTVFEYVERAQSRGWAVLVTNTNEPPPPPSSSSSGRGSSDPTAHARMALAEAAGFGCEQEQDRRNLVIIAHSYGGVCTFSLLKDPDTSRVLHGATRAIALTDSVHTCGAGGIRDPDELRAHNEARALLARIGRNWISSDLPVGQLISEADPTSGHACAEVSAGHTEHVHTSASCIDDLWEFVDGLAPPPSRGE